MKLHVRYCRKAHISLPQPFISKLFRVWRENRLSIVGPNFRLGYMRKDNEGVYVASGECQQNLILTSGAFLHRVRTTWTLSTC